MVGFKEKTENSHWRSEEAIAGNVTALQALREIIVYPLVYAREAQIIGLKWPKGLLLYGSPGSGKTSLVRAIVRESDAHLTLISPQSVHRAHVGESEKLLRDAFSEAYALASTGKPSVIFIDEIDAICPPRDSRKQHESRIVGQLLTLMDGSKSSSKSLPPISVIASTNRLDGVDPALRRPGRFDSEIEVMTPSLEERLQILELHTKGLDLDHNVDLKVVAAACNGYVGADLEALCKESAKSAYSRSLGLTKVGRIPHLKIEDWEHARSEVGPSITRGIAKEIPNVSWDDVGGLKDLKRKLQQAVEWPIKYAHAFQKLGISPVRGILLHGPPGCSKTTLAQAVAHASQASFFSLSGADLFSKYVGEGEALMRRIFHKAQQSAPSIVFFDEADTIAPKRGGSSGGNVNVGERLLSTLLTEMDGLEQATGILVLAATNRPQDIDPALRRPGRFDLILYVPPPDAEARYEILRIHTCKMKLGEDVDLRQTAEATHLYTGADLTNLCREAGYVALRENISSKCVLGRHFRAATASLTPSLTESQIKEYSTFSIDH